ncbi:hypothetical protein PENTCL1PPCAC_8908, partial [Pristionchus entomophagus]
SLIAMDQGPVSTASLFYTTHAPSNVAGADTSPKNQNLPDAVRLDHFEVRATIEWIREGGYGRVALQFPDSLLGEAVPVSRDIELALDGVQVFILADTSYRSCCVDEVAARHASCDAIVHYGDACLSALTQKIPVRYVLGRFPLDAEAFTAALSSVAFTEDPIVLLTDTQYTYAVETLAASTSTAIVRPVEACPLAAKVNGDAIENVDKERISLGRILPTGFTEMQAVQIIFVGSQNSALLPLWLLTHPQCARILHYDPTTTPGAVTVAEPSSWRGLRRRLFMVEKVRDANTIGLVVGTVAVAGHREAVHRIRALAKAAGKKVYVISVGKVNVAKLANFSADVDTFVLLSCPFGVLLDTSSFDKPVVSLFEAEIALNDGKEWMAQAGWTSDYTQFVNDSTDCPARGSDDAPDVSLVSGRIRVRATEEGGEREGGGGGEGGTVALWDAGNYFEARSWKGLDDSIATNAESEETTAILEGRKGRAAGYENELR